MENRVLIIVDAQNDFVEGGALGVEGAREKMKNLAEHIKKVGPYYYSKVLLTADSHPFKHVSFKEYGGLWPRHCVKDTEGVDFVQELKELLPSFNNPYIRYKGQDEKKEEYSVFENEINRSVIKEEVLNDNPKVDICGIAGDYCVLETIKDYLKYGFNPLNLTVLKSFIASIDGGEKLNRFVEENMLPSK